MQGGGTVQGNGLDLLPEEGGVDEEENTLDDISGDEVSEVFAVLSDILGRSYSSKNRLGNWDLAKRNISRVLLLRYESSTLILYKELSSPIFQSCESVRMRDTLPNLHFLQYIKA